MMTLLTIYLLYRLCRWGNRIDNTPDEYLSDFEKDFKHFHGDIHYPGYTRRR